MNGENNILNQLKKAKKPFVPKTFFESFANDLWQIIQLEDATEGILDSLVLKRFENDFKSSEIHDSKGVVNEIPELRLNIEKTENRRRIYWWAGAVAAGLALVFSLSIFNTSSTNVTESFSTEELLLAYLDEEDLVDFIVESSSNIETDSTDVLNEYLFEEIEDGLFEYYNDL